MIEIRSTAGELLATIEADTMRGTDYSGGTLREADLSRMDLSGAKFHAANLEQAVLNGCKLRKTDLSACDLRYAELREADLTGANLQKAQLNPSHLEGATLVGADLTGADVHGAHFEGAKFDGSTIWPAGFEPLSHGCVLASVDGEGLNESELKRMLKAGQGDEAVLRLKSQLTDMPRNPRLHHMLGLAYAFLHDKDYSLKHFLIAVDLEPDDASYQADAAKLYGSIGLPSQAVHHLELAAKLEPGNDKYNLMLAEMRAKAQH